MVLTVVAVAVMMLFSEMNAATLFAVVAGAGLIILGLLSYYRPASVIGLMVAAGSVAVSTDPGSLTVLTSLLNSILGLLAPLYVLTWVSLCSGTEEACEARLRTRASGGTILFALACVLSVPVAALLMGLVSPRFSIAMSVLAEISIILIVVIAGLIILTSKKPRSGPIIEPEPVRGPE